MMDVFIKFLIGSATLIGFMFLFALLLAYPIMWTWNYTFHNAFGLPTIDVWQALWGSVCIRLALPTSTNTINNK